MIRCSNVFKNEQGDYVTSGLEYETIVLMGPNCGIDNLDDIAILDFLCDDLGIDTMKMGASLGVAMEGGLLSFGDAQKARELLLEVGKGTLIGRILGQGSVVTGKVFGVIRVPAVKGQAMSAYDPRALKGTGVTYATSTMGADHTSGNCLPGRGGVKPSDYEGQAVVSKNLQIMSAVCDALGICIFVGPVEENMPVLSQLFSAYTGKEFSVEDVLALGTQIIKDEITFNRRAGFSSEANALPEFFRQEALPDSNLVFDIPKDY